MNAEYYYLLKFFLASFIISYILFIITLFIVYHLYNSEKASAYECGFNPFGDSRYKFEIKYFFIGILFILFDLEITFVFPWLICFYHLNFTAVWFAFTFLMCLSFGLLFEIVRKALKWR